MISFSFAPFPNLSTERLNLRSLLPGDENDFFILRSDERVMKYITRPLFTSINEAREKITNLNNGVAKDEWIFWAVIPKDSNRLIGTACLWNISRENLRAEIGYELHPDYQGNGLMREAVKAVLDYGFNVMKLHSISGTVAPDNLPSIKLLEHFGFTREAYFKEDVFYNGRFLDTVIYSLLNQSH